VRVWRVSGMEELLPVAFKGLYYGFALMGHTGPPTDFPLLKFKRAFCYLFYSYEVVFGFYCGRCKFKKQLVECPCVATGQSILIFYLSTKI
jgi:hypothetical protein